VHQQLGHAFLQKKMYAEAIASLGRAAELSGARDSAQLAYALAVAGQGEDAQRVLQILLDTGRERYLPPFHIALAYAGLGNADAAIGWLERAYEERASSMSVVNVTPGFDALRGDARFRALMLRMGLEPH
jgi:tetratricopeptide (TPR) repeat protein